MSEAKNRSRRSGSARPADDEAAPSRTERLDPGGNEWSAQEPVNPGWRRERSATRPLRRRAGALPASPQEFQLWLQNGGWRYAAIIAVLLLVLLIMLLWFARTPQRETGTGFSETPIPADTGIGVDSGIVQPALTTAALPTVPPAAPVAQSFVVTGTSTDGLFLRPEPNGNGAPLTTLPEGTRVEQIGDDFTGPDRVWRNVRAPGGQEGWVAVDFLQPAP